MNAGRHEKELAVDISPYGEEYPRIEVHYKGLEVFAMETAAPQSGTNSWKSIFGRTLCQEKKTKTLLHETSGVLRPGTMTLVLGQPSSGKSIFLKAIADRLHYSKRSCQAIGDITYNGLKQELIRKQLPQALTYVAQEDNHSATFTVQETFDFACACAGGTPHSSTIQSHTTSSKEVISHLSLQSCENTVIGDDMQRGLSGGEMKRISIGEMRFSVKPLVIMDEISTGLDSATIYDILRNERKDTDTYKKTVLISLLQPSPELLDFFDSIILYNDGYVLYNGPCQSVKSYFTAIGLTCPESRDVCDFLLDLTSVQQYQYINTTNLLSSCIPQKAVEFYNMFQHRVTTTSLADLNNKRSTISKQITDSDINYLVHLPQYIISLSQSIKLLTKRHFCTIIRNKSYIVGRLVVVIVMSLFYSTIFYQFNPLVTPVVMGVIFTIVLFLALGEISNIPVFLQERTIYYKHRAANMYSGSAYVLSQALAMFPISVMESFLFGTIMYFLTGFYAHPQTFAVYVCILILISICFSGFFFLIAMISSSVHVAKSVSILFVLYFVLFAGYVITVNNLPSYVSWLYYINPIAWCLKTIAINQYTSPGFLYCANSTSSSNSTTSTQQQPCMETMGQYLLQQYDLLSNNSWILYGIIFIASCYMLCLAFTCVVMEYIRYDTTHKKKVIEVKSTVNTTTTTTTTTNSTFQNEKLSSMELQEMYRQQVTPTSEYNEFGLLYDGNEHMNNSMSAFCAVQVTLYFSDLTYTIMPPKKKSNHNAGGSIQLLSNINGYMKPGTMTALMGASGAGKTTLLDVLAGRKNIGTISGTIVVDQKKRDSSSAASTLQMQVGVGYCEQKDYHSDTATIEEALIFSAILRQSNLSSVTDKVKFAKECLLMLELDAIRNQLVKHCNAHELKRLTIGVELAANPSLLFLDEPTTGIDARSAKLIVNCIREIANTGRTIACTIHQPSNNILQLFDQLIVLKRGGEMAYFGPIDTVHINNYFKNFFKDTNTINSDEFFCPEFNSDEGVGNIGHLLLEFIQRYHEQITDYFQISTPYLQLKDEIMQYLATSNSLESINTIIHRPHSQRVAHSVELQQVFHRTFKLYWRSSSYTRTRFLLCACVALLLGILYFNNSYRTFSSINSGIGLMFLSTLFVGMSSFNNVLPFSFHERISFYREKQVATYRIFPYFLSSTLLEIPYVYLSTLVFMIILFPLVKFGGLNEALQYWFHLSNYVLMQVYLGQMVVYMTPRLETATLMGVLINSICSLFMGFCPPHQYIPKAYRWLYYVIPPHYSFNALVSIVFGVCTGTNGQELGCLVIPNVPETIKQGIGTNTVTVKQYVEFMYGAVYNDIWINGFVCVGSIVIFRILAFLFLRYINFQKR